MKMQITLGGKAYEVEVEAEDGSPLPAPSAQLQSKLVATARPHSATGEDESKVCRSPVAGIVVRVCVQPGQAMELDQLLVVLEAMKMETNLTAPIPGKVKSVKVSPGEAVKNHQILIEFE